MIRTRDLGVTGLVVTHDMRSAFTRGRPHRDALRGRHPPGRHRRRRSGPPVIPWCASSSRVARATRPRRGGPMKRSNEFAVGLAVLAALALVIVGALWLSETGREPEGGHLHRALPHGRRPRRRGAGHAARRPGRPGGGDPPGARTNGWRPSSAWTATVDLPPKPAVISPPPACSASGAPTSFPSSRCRPIPTSAAALIESDQAGGEAWPGATLPDIGQLTAQASRIAGDVGDITNRIGQAFDSTALARTCSRA